MSQDRGRGLFITLEGADGAGKTTQRGLLAERLRAGGRTVLETREPGGTPGAEAIRGLLVDGPVERWSALSEALLMIAARVDHVERVIKPALAQGHVVVCDRFIDSTEAYQGAAGGLGADRIAALHAAALEGFAPDVTVILDVSPDVSAARAAARTGAPERFEAKGHAYQAAVREAFRAIAAREPDRCVLISAEAGSDVVAQRIWTAVEARLPGQAVHG